LIKIKNTGNLVSRYNVSHQVSHQVCCSNVASDQMQTM